MTGSNLKRTMTYAGLSSIYVKDSTQQLSLCIDQSSKVQANLTITDTGLVMGLREAFTSVLYNFRKMFNYKPSMAVSSSGELQSTFDKLGKSYGEQKACQEHQELMKFMTEYDPDSFVQPDATVSVLDKGILWEIYSKKATMGASIHLKEGFTKQSKWTQGSATCDTSLGLLYSLAKISMDSMDVSIQSNPTLSEGYKADGTYSKTENIPSYWTRTWLQLQGYFHDEKPYATLDRMETYNLIRYLRLNRPNSVVSGNKKRSLKLQLEAGKAPILTVNVFRNKVEQQEKLVCKAHTYQGPSVQVETWETDMFWYFEPLLPYLQSLKIMIGGTAQPIVVEADCGGFSLTLYSLGVSASNWTRMMEMDTYLDRRNIGKQNDPKSQTQKGLLYYNPFTKESLERTLLEGLNLDAITFRDENEEKAYRLVYFPSKDLEYSRINSVITRMRSFSNMPNTLKGIKASIQSLDEGFDALAKKHQLDRSIVKGFYKYMHQYLQPLAGILGENTFSVDSFLYDVEGTQKNRAVKDELQTFLFGKISQRKEESQKGLLETLAQKLSTRKTSVSVEQLKDLLQECTALKITGNSQFAAVDIYNALQAVVNQTSTVSESFCTELLEGKLVLIQKEVDTSKNISFIDCIVNDNNVQQKPSFSMAPYYKDGGCTCTKREGETICVHHKAVWLQHCIDEKSLREAQKSDPSLVVIQKVNFVELTSSGETSYSVEQYYHQLTVEKNGASTKRIFNDVQTAGLAFQHQIETFTLKGFLRAGE